MIMNYRNNYTNSYWNNCIEIYYHQGEKEGKTRGIEQQMKQERKENFNLNILYGCEVEQKKIKYLSDGTTNAISLFFFL